MATSTNYLWAEPNDSDLVKNGALAIRTLGNAIDTSVWNVGYGQAGKNKIINGDFGIWQRGTTVTPTNAYGYGADRWRTYSFGTSTSTLSQQSFTAGAAPVAGYEGTYFARFASTDTATFASQAIEDVRTFAGQTATISFWAKSASAQTLSAVRFDQVFGSGGSTTVTTSGTAPAITTSWARYSVTIAVPSISGKTIGTGSSLDLVIAGAINNNLDLWGLQVEAGSTATPFQIASGGSPQVELSMCQRYYVRMGVSGNASIGFGQAVSTTNFRTYIGLPVTMRSNPSVSYSGTIVLLANGSVFSPSAIGSTFAGANRSSVMQDFTTSGLTANTFGNVYTASDAADFIQFSSEL
jgi:hypothetical protein